MHEVSLAHQLARSVMRAAQGNTVTGIYVKIGHLRQVVPDSLRLAWQFTTRNTALEDSELFIESIAASALCLNCEQTMHLSRGDEFACQQCGSSHIQIRGGEEFTLTAIDVSP